MTIKINKLSIVKDGSATEVISGNIIKMHRKLKGDINVEISEGNITGSSKVAIDVVSEGLQEELYKVLEKIENELNGVGTDEGSGEETINITLNVNNFNGSSNDIEGFAKKISDSLKRHQGLR